MIKYRLICNESHEFEGWFRGSDAFDLQAESGHLSCPVCGSSAVSRAVMAPAIGGRREKGPVRQVPGPERQREIFAALRKLRSEVEANSTYVGERFADEARKIHFGETEQRLVHGEASVDDVKGLVDDGVPVMPLPRLPKDLN